jgi:hypothetical protein
MFFALVPFIDLSYLVLVTTGAAVVVVVGVSSSELEAVSDVGSSSELSVVVKLVTGVDASADMESMLVRFAFMFFISF